MMRVVLSIRARPLRRIGGGRTAICIAAASCDMEITFRLNGQETTVEAPPTRTLLDWLREDRGLTGTKEGCNEGDCGACSVIVTDARGVRALNACILFLPQVHGAAVRTVEGLAGPAGPHPAQTAMVARHGSQCGFCTPGFVVTMAAAQLNGRRDHDDQLAGNLCRCTGYAPIAAAAEDIAGLAAPAHLERPVDVPPVPGPEAVAGAVVPESADALADWYLRHPDATLIAGATDVGLWVTKGFRELGPIAFLGRCADLRGIVDRGETLVIGAATTMTEMWEAMRDRAPGYAEMIRRYGSVQVRNAATIGGNVANGSPIGDNAPALIAMGARLRLRQGDARREMAVEDFFLDYGRQDRRPGEFVEALVLPARAPDLRVYKVSKRFDQDISAVCGAFDIRVADGAVTEARIAYGGMAATPKRARAMEAALRDRPWEEATVARAAEAVGEDFTPIGDMRASAGYRLRVAGNLLRRYWMEREGAATSVLEVRP